MGPVAATRQMLYPGLADRSGVDQAIGSATKAVLSRSPCDRFLIRISSAPKSSSRSLPICVRSAAAGEVDVLAIGGAGGAGGAQPPAPGTSKPRGFYSLEQLLSVAPAGTPPAPHIPMATA